MGGGAPFHFFPSLGLRVTSNLDGGQIALEGQTRWPLGHEWPACSVLEAERALSCSISRSNWLETQWTWDEVTTNHASSPKIFFVCVAPVPHMTCYFPLKSKAHRPGTETGSQSVISDWQPHNCHFKKLGPFGVGLPTGVLFPGGGGGGRLVLPLWAFLKPVVLCIDRAEALWAFPIHSVVSIGAIFIWPWKHTYKWHVNTHKHVATEMRNRGCDLGEQGGVGTWEGWEGGKGKQK